MLQRTGPLVATGEYGSRAPMRLLAKDIALVREVADEVGMPLPLSERTCELLEEAVRRGYGEVDVAGLAMLIARSGPR